MRSALVHEWLQDLAGSEQTFLRMAESLPSADLFALTVNPETDFGLDRPIRTTMLQATKFTRERRGLTLPLMPLAWKALRPQDRYDLVVTSSHAFSRYFSAVSSVNYCYVHAPMRYVWSPDIDQRAAMVGLSPARFVLKRLDLRSTRAVDEFAANSTAVAERIARFYGRESRVIFPPVDLAKFRPGAGGNLDSERFLLGFSRWIPYKRLDLVIRVGEALQMPVVIAGRGSQSGPLRAIAAAARTKVTIVESPTDVELAELMRRSAALVFPSHEDFGIVPVEAQASGTKVVALDCGGSRDTVIDRVTGVLSPTQDVADMVDATRLCLALGDRRDECVANAERFSVDAFKKSFGAWVREAA